MQDRSPAERGVLGDPAQCREGPPPNAEKVHRTITEMLVRGFSPRAVQRHLDGSGLWASWPASERVSYTTIWRHGRECMGWLQQMRQNILEKNLHNRGETIDTFTGAMAGMLGGVEVAVQANLNRLVADEVVPETLTEPTRSSPRPSPS